MSSNHRELHGAIFFTSTGLITQRYGILWPVGSNSHKLAYSEQFLLHKLRHFMKAFLRNGHETGGCVKKIQTRNGTCSFIGCKGKPRRVCDNTCHAHKEVCGALGVQPCIVCAAIKTLRSSITCVNLLVVVLQPALEAKNCRSNNLEELDSSAFFSIIIRHKNGCVCKSVCGGVREAIKTFSETGRRWFSSLWEYFLWFDWSFCLQHEKQLLSKVVDLRWT